MSLRAFQIATGVLSVLTVLFIILFAVYESKNSSCNTSLTTAVNNLNTANSNLASANNTVNTYTYAIDNWKYMISSIPVFYLIAQRVYNQGPFTNTTNFPPILTYSMLLNDPVSGHILNSYRLTNDDSANNITRGMISGLFFDRNTVKYSTVTCPITLADTRIPISNLPDLSKILTPSAASCVTNGITSNTSACDPWVVDYITGYSFSNQCANPPSG